MAYWTAEAAGHVTGAWNETTDVDLTSVCFAQKSNDEDWLEFTLETSS